LLTIVSATMTWLPKLRSGQATLEGVAGADAVVHFWTCRHSFSEESTQ
jgi:hypothetical protein